eukprot:3415425-Amphidinium_carterae.2
MSLPHAGILQDILLGAQGEVQITAEDCSDYFYMRRLPDHLHPHTVIGWDLPLRAIDPLQLERDQKGRVLEDSDCFAAALMVVPMGDKRAMEIAQGVHQHIHLKSGALLPKAQLSHGWPLPGGPSFWGCYCDDLALLDMLHPKLEGACAASRVAAESVARLDRVKERSVEERLQLKQSKEQLRLKELQRSHRLGRLFVIQAR